MGFTWLVDHRTFAVSLSSVVISAIALIVAIRAQHANYRLARTVAEKAGRLQNITVVRLDAGSRYTRGFKVLNGPDEITVTDARFLVTYSLVERNKLIGAARFMFTLRSTCFDILGIEGPSLPLRLAPYEEIVWRLPRYARDLDLMSTPEETTYDQFLRLQLEVTASGATAVSSKISIGLRQQVFWYNSTDSFDSDSLISVLERTQASYREGGQKWIGLHEWLLSLIQKTASDAI